MARSKLVGSGPEALSARDLSARAQKARTRHDWSADIYYRRLILERNGGSAGAWLQYGHAAKEAGFHARAEGAYRQALSLKPDDAETILQLAHLAKVRGRFKDAATLYADARGLNHPQGEEIDLELSRLRRLSGEVFAEAPKDGNRAGLKVYLSAPRGRVSETDRSAVGVNLATADYSYAFAMRGFLQGLEAMGIDHAVIEHPEYMADIRDRSSAETIVHIGFYPPENLRLLKGAYNINCCAWEFDRLRSPEEQTSYHAFADPRSMLNIADEVWALSQAGAQAFVASGVSAPVHAVSAPVLDDLADRPKTLLAPWKAVDATASRLGKTSWQPLAITPRIQPAMDQGSAARRGTLRNVLGGFDMDEPPLVFLTIFNMHDYRKNIRPLVLGFLKFCKTHRNAVLLLKTSTPARGFEPTNFLLFKEQLGLVDALFPPLLSEQVWMTDQVLTRDEMNALYDVSQFYVCTSHGEGQNLPLIEAMGRGVVPVSVDHTAMAEYIDENNAIIIPSEKGVFDRRLANRYRMYGANAYYCSPQDVASALRHAQDLDETAYAARSQAAIDTVRHRFGLEPFSTAVRGLMDRLGARPARSADA